MNELIQMAIDNWDFVFIGCWFIYALIVEPAGTIILTSIVGLWCCSVVLTSQ